MGKKIFGAIAVVAVSFFFMSLNNKTAFANEQHEEIDITSIDDSYLHLFSEETKLDSTKGSFTGFPTAVVHKGTIYVLYGYHTQHQSVPGVEQDYCYYRYSKDGGKTWSERKQLEMPRSKIPGISYDYRKLQLVDDGNRMLGTGIIVPSDANHIKAYRPYFCCLKAKKNGELKYSRFQLLPYVSEDGKEVTAPITHGENKGSNIIEGNMLLIDGKLYWCYYNSVRNVQLLRWDTRKGKIPTFNTTEVLVNIGDNNNEHSYSEVGMFYNDGVIYLSIRDEKATNSNWTYNTVTQELNHVNNTETRAFGPHIYKPKEGPILLTGRQYTYLKKREQLTRMDNIMSPSGEIIKENIGFVGHSMGGDSMYCSTVEYEGRLFIFYYYGMNSSQVSPNSRYTLAYKTIRVDDLKQMLD